MSTLTSHGKHASGAKKTDKSAEDAQSEETAVEEAAEEELEASEGEPTEDAEELEEDLSEGDEVSGSDDAQRPKGNGSLRTIPTVEPMESGPGPATGFVAAEFGEIPKKKRRRGLKAIGITLGVLVVVALIAYVAGAIVFSSRFLPNTAIGENDISLKTDAEVAELLNGITDDYRLDVIGSGFAYRMSGKEIGLSVDADSVIAAMHSELNAWEWPLLMLQPSHDESAQLATTFKRTAYESDLTAAIEKYNETAKAPVNATIVYDDKNDKFVVKPEEIGSQLNVDAVLAAVSQAIVDLEPKLSLGEEQLIQPTVFSDDKKLIEAAELATGMVSAKLTLVMGGQNVDEVNGDTLSAFITVNDNFEVTFREDEMNAWVDSLAANFNTVGTERTYTREDGKPIAVSGGVYGWEIDSEALKNAVVEGIKAGTTAELEVPCIETAELYAGANQRDWGNRYIDVDITEQHVRFYGDDGKVFWEADCISGMPDGKHDTEKGVWYVNAKESPSKLIGYENGKKIYETKVQFWMPFEGNGIGFHDATWQPSFGGSMYANGYGSHGCVNLSYGDAETLYGLIEEGDIVVVHA